MLHFNFYNFCPHQKSLYSVLFNFLIALQAEDLGPLIFSLFGNFLKEVDSVASILFYFLLDLEPQLILFITDLHLSTDRFAKLKIEVALIFSTKLNNIQFIYFIFLN